jgi:hypothetical protein
VDPPLVDNPMEILGDQLILGVEEVEHAPQLKGWNVISYKCSEYMLSIEREVVEPFTS